MNFDLIRPCAKCPFRRDCLEGWLDRRADIPDGLESGSTFVCHEIIEFDEDDGGYAPSNHDQHCAGALIVLERMELPNQMMRIAERLGFYDASKLDRDANVFDDLDEFREHHQIETWA